MDGSPRRHALEKPARRRRARIGGCPCGTASAEEKGRALDDDRRCARTRRGERECRLRARQRPVASSWGSFGPRPCAGRGLRSLLGPSDESVIEGFDHRSGRVRRRRGHPHAVVWCERCDGRPPIARREVRTGMGMQKPRGEAVVDHGGDIGMRQGPIDEATGNVDHQQALSLRIEWGPGDVWSRRPSRRIGRGRRDLRHVRGSRTREAEKERARNDVSGPLE